MTRERAARIGRDDLEWTEAVRRDDQEIARVGELVEWEQAARLGLAVGAVIDVQRAEPLLGEKKTRRLEVARVVVVGGAGSLVWI